MQAAEYPQPDLGLNGLAAQNGQSQQQKAYFSPNSASGVHMNIGICPL
jgi:hypothetical protein